MPVSKYKNVKTKKVSIFLEKLGRKLKNCFGHFKWHRRHLCLCLIERYLRLETFWDSYLQICTCPFSPVAKFLKQLNLQKTFPLLKTFYCLEKAKWTQTVRFTACAFFQETVLNRHPLWVTGGDVAPGSRASLTCGTHGGGSIQRVWQACAETRPRSTPQILPICMWKILRKKCVKKKSTPCCKNWPEMLTSREMNIFCVGGGDQPSKVLDPHLSFLLFWRKVREKEREEIESQRERMKRFSLEDWSQKKRSRCFKVNQPSTCTTRTPRKEGKTRRQLFFTSLPLKKARSSIGAPVVLRATGPLV